MRRLIIRPGAIGDCILSLPAMESLRSSYLEIWTPSPVVPLIRFADRVRALASTGLDLLGIQDVAQPNGLLESLRGFDSIVSWYGSNRVDFRAAVASLGLPFDFLAALPDGAGEHAADFFSRQAAAIGGQTAATDPTLPCRRSRAGYAVMHPFSGSSKKNWPLDRYRRLAEQLSARVPVKWCAGPEENLAEATRFEDLFDLACWLAGAEIYIGNDSGITHLAAAAGTPVVALFGPTDPSVWAPRGPNVTLVATHAVGDPMEAIPFDRIASSVEEFLDRVATSR